MYENDMQVIEEISKITGVKYSDEQIEVLKHRGGMCILACAGSGKTTVLTHLLAKRIKTGEITNTSKLLCTTYSKAGATEMEERLEKLLKKLGIKSKIQVKTLHASYFMVLRHFGLQSGVCGGSQRLLFITQACREAGVQLADEDLQTLDSLLSYQVNNLLSDEGLVHSYVYTLEDLELNQYSMIRLGYNRKKEEAKVIDFDDMQLFMYAMLVIQKRQDVLQFCRNLWTDFFVDEFQDVSKIQFGILKELITSPDKLIVIGDDDQCIYQWRGADPSIILNICGYYDIRSFVLSTNYRCGGEIVKHAAVGITNNEKRANKTMIPFNQGGRIRIANTGNGNIYEMSKYAYKHIMDTIKNEGVAPNNIAVLSRNNQHLSILSNMLFKNGIYCVTSPEMRLSNMTMYKDIKNVLELAENTYNHHLVASTLWRVCTYLGGRGSKMFSELMSSSSCSLKDALGYVLTNIADRGSEINWLGKLKVPNRAHDKMAYQYTSIQPATEANLVLIYRALDNKNEYDRISDLLEMYIIATEFMHKSQDKCRTVNGLVEYIKSLVVEKGLKETKSFLRFTEQYESGTMEVPGHKLVMSTMHGAKGREWEHVIIFADDNITFPSFEGITKMIQDKVESSDISGSIDENRRLHYVAMTRAKKELVIFCDASNISVYTLEALGIIKRADIKNNQHIINMAEAGELPQPICDEVYKMAFEEGSRYYYKIDIDNGKNKLTRQNDNVEDFE